MLSRPRNIYTLCVFSAFLFCILIGLRSYKFGNREETEHIWYRPINYPLNDLEIKDVNNENVSTEEHETSNLKLKDSKQKQETFHGNVKDPLQPGTVRTVIDSKGVDFSDSNKCMKREVKLSGTVLPITGLVSFPGSGNTWMRHLIQQMTGIGTSSVYCDRSLKASSFPHECKRQRGKTIVVKTHKARHFHMFKKIVLLVRNPYDALLSYVSFAKAGHTGHPSKQVLIQARAKMYNHSLKMYVNLIRNTIGKFKGAVHVVQYENVKSNMAKELRSLATFLNANVSDHDITCTVKTQEGNFQRKASDAEHIQLLRTLYTKEKLPLLREAARTSEKLLKDAYNKTFDLGGSVEKTLFQNS